MKRFMVVVSVLISVSAWAGQAWFGSPSGVPYHWANNVIEWTPDANDLSAGYDNKKATDMVAKAFAAWTGAGLQNAAAGKFMPTAVLQATQKPVWSAGLSADPESPNYYQTVAQQVPALIVFDKVAVEDPTTKEVKNGAILTDYCVIAGCTASLNSILAMTVINPTDLDDAAVSFQHGYTILDGTKISRTYTNGDSGEDRFYAAILHELGHLLGVDHTGLNDAATIADSKLNRTIKPGVTTNAIPTMYPVNLTSDQKTLHNDDVIAISTLYPSDAFTSQFCTITGKVTDDKGVGVQGIEVVARTTIAADLATDAMSTMTGANFPVPTNDGHYYIRGVVPKKSYVVGVAPLPKFLSDGSGIGMFGTQVDKNGKFVTVATPTFTMPCEGLSAERCDAKGRDLTAAGGATYTVSCEKGGQTIVMDTLSLGAVTMDSKYATAATPTVSEPQPVAPPATSSGKSGCSLIR